MHQAFALFRNRDFTFAWITTIIEHIALAVTLLAETWFVVDTLQMKAQLGWVMIAGTVPRIALMAIGGVLADRHSKIRILKLTFWLRMLVLALGAVLFWIGWMTIWALIAFAALFGILDAFFWPARDALLPSIVEEKHLTQANSLMQATNQVGLVFGPVIGGLLLYLLPLHWILAMTATAMAIGALLIARIDDRHVPHVSGKRHLVADLKEGVAYVVASPVLRTLMTIYIVANLLFMGPIGLGVPIIASEHLTHGAIGLSYMQSAFGIGMVLGFLTLFAFPPQRKRLLLISVLIVVEGVLLGLLGNVYLLWPAVILQFMIGFCIACNNVPMLSLIQQYTERGKLGRVMSLTSVASMGLSPLSYAMVSSVCCIGGRASRLSVHTRKRSLRLTG
ncbi:MAG: hypothetical protein K0S28_892, partial [Paucimonas sp.]|nr:hypothetical protein [Paucimonas sp.]